MMTVGDRKQRERTSRLFAHPNEFPRENLGKICLDVYKLDTYFLRLSLHKPLGLAKNSCFYPERSKVNLIVTEKRSQNCFD